VDDILGGFIDTIESLEEQLTIIEDKNAGLDDETEEFLKNVSGTINCLNLLTANS
jgi:hypothetical protein